MNNSDFALARYNINGTLEKSFGNAGIVISELGTIIDEAYALALQSNGRIVVAGRSGGYQLAVSRYMP